jgi:hypothetical protein
VHDVNNVARPTPEHSNTIGMRIWCTSCLTIGCTAALAATPFEGRFAG